MHRKLRQFFSQISLALVMITGVWLAAPRDVCLTKTFTGACACPAENTQAGGCECCDAAKAPVKKSCCDKETEPTDNGAKSAGCLSVSSGHLKVPTPERIYTPDFAMVTLAVLPFHESIISDSSIAEMQPQADVACIDRKNISRDNCVYLI